VTPERWQRVKEVFSAASEMEAGRVDAYLDAACGDDAPLRAEVASLLGAHTAEDAVVVQPAAAHLAGELLGADDDRWIGKRIGAYEIVSLIGHGGMGEVYRARRVDAQYEKEVAIKLVPGGLHAAFVLQRVRAERQILAGLDHPSIARLIDGGMTEDGAPYLVMELVDGLPLDRYATERSLPLRERLALLLDVCDAVSYAHQRLVVHRDLKPGNILVTQEGAVKLLDFGIAKLLQPAGADTTTTATVTLMRTLTPGYASPEQILGRTITTASDVYSLGVVLHVLLTGRSPYRGAMHSAEDAIRDICDTEPTRPSAAAAEDPRPGDEPISRDLDAIVLQALRKEPERRYASVEQLAEDIRRFLDGRPVAARGDQLGYRAGKVVRRHRVEVAAAALLSLTLVAATVVSLREARIAEAQRERAERHFVSVRGLANAFMFEIHDSIESLPGATRAREILVSNALKYLNTLADEAGQDSGLRLELAAAYEKVANIQGQAYGASKGDARAAIESYGKAIALLEPIAAAQPENTDAVSALSRASMLESRLLLLQGKVPEAVAGSRRAIDLLEPIVRAQPQAEYRAQLASALTVHVVNLYYSGGAKDERLAFGRRSIALLEELVRDDPDNDALAEDLSTAYNSLASSLPGPERDMAVVQEGLALYRKALAIEERLLAKSGGKNVDHLRGLMVVRMNVSLNLSEAGDTEAALETLADTEVLLARRAADPDDVQVRLDAVLMAWHKGRFLRELGREREAERVLSDNVAAIRVLDVEDDNLQVVFVRAACENQLGLIESARAVRPGLGRAARLRHWRRARDLFASAVPAFERVTAVATLDFMDLWSVHSAGEGLASSQAEVARLEGTGSAG
jgi:tetratricopeptide (TPR) repeat protein